MYACLLSDIMEDENNELAIINNRCILLRICIVHRGSFSIHFSFHSFIAIKTVLVVIKPLYLIEITSKQIKIDFMYDFAE